MKWATRKRTSLWLCYNQLQAVFATCWKGHVVPLLSFTNIKEDRWKTLSITAQRRFGVNSIQALSWTTRKEYSRFLFPAATELAGLFWPQTRISEPDSSHHPVRTGETAESLWSSWQLVSVRHLSRSFLGLKLYLIRMCHAWFSFWNIKLASNQPPLPCFVWPETLISKLVDHLLPATNGSRTSWSENWMFWVALYPHTHTHTRSTFDSWWSILLS